jgi:hypothetical protein
MFALRIAVVFALLPQLTENFFAVYWLESVGFDVIIASVKHVANLRQSREVSGHGVLNEIVGSAAGCSGKFLET